MGGGDYYLTTDTHFGHKNIVTSGYRDIDFEDRIISEIEKIPNDATLIHLGDVVFSYNEKANQFFSLLMIRNGANILVSGNHDSKSYKWYRDHGFDFVCENFTIKYKGKNIVFSHAPIDLCCDYNCHGHLHTGRHRGVEPWYDDRHKLLSMENNNYKSIELSKFLKL